MLAKAVVGGRYRIETNGTLNEVVIFPPFTSLECVADAIDGKHVGYGA